MNRRRFRQSQLAAALVAALLLVFLALWVTVALVQYTTGSPGDVALVLLVTLLFAVTATLVATSTIHRNARLQRDLLAAARRRADGEEIAFAAAGLAHETKNPLGIIRGLAQQITDNPDIPETTRTKARQIMEEADVTTARLGDFLSYARKREPHWNPVDALPCLTELTDLVRDEFETKGVQLTLDIQDLTLRWDRDLISQILLNLLNNSLQATRPGDAVTVRLQRTRAGTVQLAILDTGPGIEAEFLPFLFKPYMSKRRGGYGLGLAIVKRIVDQCGWHIDVVSTPETGTAFRIGGMQETETGTS